MRVAFLDRVFGDFEPPAMPEMPDPAIVMPAPPRAPRRPPSRNRPDAARDMQLRDLSAAVDAAINSIGNRRGREAARRALDELRRIAEDERRRQRER
jgi:hypothetical protein